MKVLRLPAYAVLLLLLSTLVSCGKDNSAPGSGDTQLVYHKEWPHQDIIIDSISLGNDDLVAPDPSSDGFYFVHHEVWRYETEYGATITIYLNTTDSTFFCHTIQPEGPPVNLNFYNGTGRLEYKVRTAYDNTVYPSVPIGEYPALVVYWDNPIRSREFRIDNFDGETIKLDYYGIREYACIRSVMCEYYFTFNKLH